MSTSKTVALVEFGWYGHLPTYFKAICSALLSAGCRVVALCPCPEEMETWALEQGVAEGRLSCAKITDEVQQRYWVRKSPQLANLYRLQQSGRLLARQETALGWKVNLVFFACLYSGAAFYPIWVDRVFPYPWTALLLDSTCVRWSRWRQSWPMRSLDSLALFRAKQCRSLATLDGGIADTLSQRLGGKPVHALPDLAESSVPEAADFARALPADILRRAAGRRIIGCCGQFTPRKGAKMFLEAACRCVSDPWFFVWVGENELSRFAPSERAWINGYLASNPSNCFVHLDRVPDEREYNTLINLMDVLFLCYRNHPGSSNTISKAAAFEKPVLVSDGYCMAEQTRRYDLGLCVPENDIDAAESALRRLLAGDEKLPPPRYEAYREDHSKKRFNEVVRAMTIADNSTVPHDYEEVNLT